MKTFCLLHVSITWLLVFLVLDCGKVHTSGYETIGNIWSVVPAATESIAHGGLGLIKMKLDFDRRLINLLVSPITNVFSSTTANMTDLEPTAPEGHFSSTASPSAFSFANFLSYLGMEGGKDSNIVNSTLISSNSSLPIDDGEEYFPIPGLKIGFDNETGKYELTHGSEFYPSVLLPPNYVNYDGYNSSTPFDMQNQKSLFELLNISKNHEYLLYPALPATVHANNVQEPGYMTVSNTSQLIKIANGKLMNLPDNANVTFEGFSEGQSSELNASSDGTTDRGNNGTATHDPVISNSSTDALGSDNVTIAESTDVDDFLSDSSGVKQGNHVRGQLSRIESKFSVVPALPFGAPLAMRMSRPKRHLTPYVIPRYFNLIYNLDTDRCFSKMLCEIGYNFTSYGKYGSNLNNFFEGYNVTSFPENSTSRFYIERYYLGREHDSNYCHEEICHQNMATLVKSINAF